MNSKEASVDLQSDNADLILVRVSGSIKIVRLPQELQGEINWIQRDEILKELLERMEGKDKGLLVTSCTSTMRWR